MKRVLAGLLLIFFAGSLYGAPAWQFRHLNTRGGLSSNTVRSLIQDRSGLIWAGTSDGLDSFDGREVIHHSLPPLANSYINCLLEDSAGTLWAGTDDAIYRYTDSGLTREDALPAANYNCLAEDRDGNVWIGTYDSGIIRMGNGTVHRYLEGESAEAILISGDGRIWAASPTAPEGVYLYNPSADAFVSPSFDFKDTERARVCAMAEDATGNLWLGTWDRGLYRVETATGAVSNPVKGGKGLSHIHSMMQDSPLTFLVGSDDGLLRVNPFTLESTLYSSDRNDPASLSNKFVYPIIRDHEGGLWIGTYYGGVNYVSPTIGQFRSLSLGKLTGSEDCTVSCFCEDPDGTIWMGSDNGGLFSFNPANGTARKLDRFSQLNIHALCRRGDDLWTGSYSSPTVRLNLSTGRTQLYEIQSVYSFFTDADGTLWAGTDDGIYRFDDGADAFVQERLTGDITISVAQDRDGTLWFGTSSKGIMKRTAGGEWSSLSADNSDLPSSEINFLLPGRRGMMAGSRRGLVLFGEDGISSTLEDADVRFIAEGGSDLWISSSSAVGRCSPEQKALEWYRDNDGVTCSQFLPAAGLTARDGRVYMGATDGFVSFLPGAVQPNPYPPTVLFTRFSARGPGVTENVFHTQGTENIRLGWKLRDVTIGFAALSYCAPEKVRYAYLLEGDGRPEWQQLGNQNRINFSRLSPGRYRLHVKACNNSGVWNDGGATLEFQIRPHPLLSRTAITLYIVLAVFAVYWLLRSLIRRAERKNRVQYARELDEAVSHVKEEELDDRYQLVSGLADQLEAPVAGIGLQLRQLREHPGGKADLSIIEKNHRMLRTITANLRQMGESLSAGRPAREKDSAPSPDEDFVLRLDRIIAENLSNPELSVNFLAKEMAISRSGLFAKAKELCGETPNNLINQARLNQAAALLSEGRYTVGEICYMTGFSSPSYFSKIFVSQFGLAPHEWAKKQAE